MSRVAIFVVLTSTLLTVACNPTTQNVTADLEARVKALEDTVKEHHDRLARTKRNPATTTIVLSKSPSGTTCDTAKVLDYRVGNQHERHVRWNIEDECNLLGFWRLELTFTPKDGQYPFPDETLRSRGNNRFIQDKIKRSADVATGVYSYKIYLVRGINGEPVELADPELEVEPPPIVVTTAAPPTPAPPAPKKQ